MDASSDIVLRISPQKASIVVEEHKNGIVSRKEISRENLFSCLFASIENQPFRSGFLPENCLALDIKSGEIRITLLSSGQYADIKYYKTAYDRFPLPRMVFSFDVNIISGSVNHARLGVIAEGRVTPESTMFHYPFSNVSRSGICTGLTPLPKYKKLHTIATLPNYIMGIPNNDDSYKPSRNKMKLGYRDLLEHLKDKEPDYYYGNILVPNGHTLQDFIDGRY